MSLTIGPSAARLVPLRMAVSLRHVLRFRRNEDGSATVEFVILFPIFMAIFCAAFEVGLLMTRQVMLEHGIDKTVRAIRLGTTSPGPVDVTDIKTMVCNGAAIIPDCMAQLKVEMQPLDPRALVNIPTRADCVDRNDPAVPSRTFVSGTQNQLMILRICLLIDPLFPGTDFGFQLPEHSGGGTAIVAATAFVMEP